MTAEKLTKTEQGNLIVETTKEEVHKQEYRPLEIDAEIIRLEVQLNKWKVYKLEIEKVE